MIVRFLSFPQLFFVIIFSVITFPAEELFIVTDRPLRGPANVVGSNSIKYKKGGAVIQSNAFEHSAIQRISLFSSFQQGVSSQSIGRPLGTGSDEYVYLVRLDDAYLDQFKQKVASLDGVIHIQPNYRYSIRSVRSLSRSLAESEPSYSQYQQTEMALMAFPDVWDDSTGEGTRVAVLDTGIRETHKEFCGSSGYTSCAKLVAPYDFIDSPNIPAYKKVTGEDYETPDDNPEDTHGHGSHVAGIIAAAQNNFGVIGAAFDAKIIPIRVMFRVRGGDAEGFTSDIINGINYAVTNDADIINMSLGGPNSTVNDLLMRQAVDNATAQGALVVAASGNDSLNFDENTIAPAYFPNAMAVGSVNNVGQLSNFSNFGDTLDVVAVGGGGVDCSEPVTNVGVQTDSDFVGLCGTSMATPYVSALAAVIQSYYIQNNQPKLPPADVRRLIQISATSESDGTTLKKGHGLINARRALFFSGASHLADTDSTASIFVGSDGSSSHLLCYPNPYDRFSSSMTTCSFRLNRAATIQWSVYSRRGQVVQRGEIYKGAGTHDVSWDGRDYNGEDVPIGVYQMLMRIQPTDGSSALARRHLISLVR